MTSIHDLPPELHSYIAYLSCLADPGHSILSLSRLSRYFHEVSRPFVFHTVSVIGPRAITQLDRSLQSYAESTPCSPGSGMKNLYLGMNQPPSPFERGTFVATACRILSFSSGSLETLAIDFSAAMQDSTQLLARVLRISFPLLQDLTLVGFYPNPTIPSPPSSRRPSLPSSPTSSHPPSPTTTRVTIGEVMERETNFPSVKRLHLSGNRNPTGLLSVGSVATVFPALESMKISGLSMAVGFAEEIKQALPDLRPEPSLLHSSSLSADEAAIRNGIQSISFAGFETDPYAKSSFGFAPRLPPRLRVLQVQPAPAIQPSTGPASNTTAVLKDEGMMGIMRELEGAYGGRNSMDGGEESETHAVFGLLERGKVDRHEVWEQWRGALCG